MKLAKINGFTNTKECRHAVRCLTISVPKAHFHAAAYAGQQAKKPATQYKPRAMAAFKM